MTDQTPRDRLIKYILPLVPYDTSYRRDAAEGFLDGLLSNFAIVVDSDLRGLVTAERSTARATAVGINEWGETLYVLRQIDLMRSQLDEAYKRGPQGTWAQRWINGVCHHEQVRCTHGDEILGRRGRRRVCLDCGRSLRGPLPEMCFFTDRPHR